MGSGATSSSTVLVSGPGAEWNAGNLLVANEGSASVAITGEGARLTATSASFGSAGGTGTLTVSNQAVATIATTTILSGSESRITVSGFGTSLGTRELVIGAGALELLDFGQVQVTGLVDVRAGGTILGSGSVVADLVSSRGQIQSTDLAFQSDVTLMSSSTLSTTAGGSTSVRGDFSHNGNTVFTDAGGTLLIGGVASGVGNYTGEGNVIFQGELSPGNSAAVISFGGNVQLDSLAQTSIELGGTHAGEFDQLLIDGGFIINGDLSVSLIDGFTLGSGMQFQFADVEGFQFGNFQRASDGAFLFEGDTVGNFGGHDLFITYDGFGGNAGVGLFTAVPEPSGGVLVLLLGCAACLRRSRSGLST